MIVATTYAGIILVVVSIVLLLVNLFRLRGSDYVSQQEIQSTFGEMREELAHSLKKLQAETLEKDEIILKMSEERTADKTELRKYRDVVGKFTLEQKKHAKMIDELVDQVSTLSKEKDEIADFAFLALQWIKHALTIFKSENLQPPEGTEELMEFEEKYHGRFKGE